jgi:hypothetical protein
VQFLASYLLANRLQGVGVIAALLGLSLILPPVGLLSSAGIALVTLRKGSAEGLTMISLSALLSAVLGGLFVGNAAAFALYGAVLWLPAWLVAWVLRERIDLALALEAGCGLASAAVIAIYASVEQPAELWAGSMQRMLQPLLENPPPGFEAEQLLQQLGTLPHYMTGMAAAGSLLGVSLALFLARWWQAQLFNPGGFGPEYRALRGHRPMAYASGLLLLTTWAATGATAEIAANLLTIAAAFYIVAGVAVIHSLCYGLSAKRFLLILLYGIVLVIPHALLPIALVGLADVWLNLRRWSRAAEPSV